MSGPPVVLVHGFSGSADRTWRPAGWFDLLADAGRTVVGIDLLGHGTAPKPHDPDQYQQLEERARAELPDEPCDAIGFSLGAQVLLRLAAAEPSRFRRLVVAGVGANLFSSTRSDDLAALLAGEGDAATSPTARYFAAQAEANDADPLALAAYLRREGHGPMTAELLGRIELPVLVVLGDRDFVGPPDELLAGLPDARLVTLPGIDHFATPKQFAFLDAALEFLDAVPT